jgi:S-adenosylmethionine decarboxylase
MQDMIVGKHVYGNLYGLESSVLTDEKRLRDIMIKAAEIAKSTILDVKSWSIPGKRGGVSVIVLVDESHLALHTWNEYSYATLDIYTCGAHTDPEAAFEYVIKELKPKRYTKHKVMRVSDPQTVYNI